MTVISSECPEHACQPISVHRVTAIVLTTRGRRQPLEEKQMEDIQFMNESWTIIIQEGIATNTTLASTVGIFEGESRTLPFCWQLTRSDIFIVCSHFMRENFLRRCYCEHYMQSGWNTKSILAPENNLFVLWVADPTAKPNPQYQIRDKLAMNAN